MDDVFISIFQDAKDQFESSLSPEHRRNFVGYPSAEAMMKDMDFCAEARKSQRFDRAIKKVNQFNKALQPYFEVVSIFVSSNPQYAAIAWGAVRLALKLASNYVTFFEKLSNSLEKIAEKLPRCHDKFLLFVHSEEEKRTVAIKKASTRLQSSLVRVYIGFLNYFQAVVEVFTKSDGVPRGAVTVVRKLFLKPFDVRFREFLGSIDEHFRIFNDDYEQLVRTHEVVAREIEAEERAHAQIERINAAAAREILQQVDDKTSEISRFLVEQERDRLIQRIRQWLDPPNYAQEYENLRRETCEATAMWIFEEPIFQTWLRSNEKNIEIRDDSPLINPNLGNILAPTFNGRPIAEENRPGSSTNKDARESLPEGCEDIVMGATTEGGIEESESVELNSESDKILWILGNPGCGKSVLAASIVDHLSHDGDGATICYFFFRDQDPTLRTSTAALRSILAQLLCRYSMLQQVMDAFVFAITGMSSGQATATTEELADTMQAILSCLPECIFVIDGIDECQDSFDLLLRLTSSVKQIGYRLILCSRPVLSHGLAGKDGLALPVGKSNQKDIEIYLRYKLRDMMTSHLLPGDADENVLLERFKIGSDGMFLWARLMILYLQSPALTRTQRIKTIMQINLPEGLEAMYDRLMSVISLKHRVEQNLAMLVLSFTTYAIKPLTCVELFEFLKISDDPDTENDGDYTDLDDTVMLSCSGLIEKTSLIDPRYNSPRETYRLIHLSAKEYLKGKSIFANISTGVQEANVTSRPDEVYTHFRFAHRCLRYLTHKVPAQQLTGKLNTQMDPPTLDKTFPLLHYAALHWTEHVRVVQAINSTLRGSGSIPDQHNWYTEFLSSLMNFMKQKLVLTSWIEASYAFRKPPNFQSVVYWMSLLDLVIKKSDYAQLRGDCNDFGIYLQKLEEAWGARLLATPYLLWEEVIAFTPCRLLAKTDVADVSTLVSTKLNRRHIFPRHLCKISELTLDGRWVVVLSVWPSKKFNAVFLDNTPCPIEMRKACSGWIARVEIWSTDTSSKRVADMEIHLDQDEIWLQVRQSLVTDRNASSGLLSWKVHFPLAIHPSGLCFTILRTIYRLPSAINGSRPQSIVVTSRFLPLDFESMEWSSNPTDDSNLDFNRNSRRPSLYLYSTSFSPNGQYLSFTHSHNTGRLELTTIEIIFNHDHAFKSRLVRSTETHVDCEAVWAESFKLMFHPKLPILAFLCHNRAYLWIFGAEPTRVTPCYGRFPRIEGLAFSHCGRFLIIDDAFGDCPVVWPLPELKKFIGCQIETLRPPFSTDSSDAVASKHSSIAIASQNVVPPHIVREGTGALDISAQTFSINRSSSSQDALVCERRDGVRVTGATEITKLPNWPDIAATNITVKLPRCKDEMIQIILNKAEKTWYSTADPEDSYLPVILRRDPAVLSQRLIYRKRCLELDNASYSAKRRRESDTD
ncbi:hypothetical protein F4679DRAFT_592262 [Xylaria curta]|nr:hypothetical protein F4679DRAFT_592262 [Xylaria curta]